MAWPNPSEYVGMEVRIPVARYAPDVGHTIAAETPIEYLVELIECLMPGEEVPVSYEVLGSLDPIAARDFRRLCDSFCIERRPDPMADRVWFRLRDEALRDPYRTENT